MASNEVKPEELLAEIEDVLRTMPPRETLHHETPEVFGWIGRAVAVIACWNVIQGPFARRHALNLHDGDVSVSNEGFVGLIMLLNEAWGRLEDEDYRAGQRCDWIGVGICLF
jgi:hypothetical protein